MSWRVSKISGTAGPSWRVSKISGVLSYTRNSWRVSKLSGTVSGGWRVSKISGGLGYTTAPVLANPATQTVDPLTVVTLTAVVTNGVVPDSYTFTSAGLVFTQNGNTITFQAPGTPTGGTVTVTITAVKGASTSNTATASVIVGPAPGAYKRADGSIGALSNPYQA